MIASVTNWVRSAKIELSDEQLKRLTGGDNPDSVLEESQWTQIRAKLPKTPTDDLVFRKVDPETGRCTYELIWYHGMNDKPRYMRKFFTE